MISELRQKATEHNIHTVEVGAPDTQGRLRGKRVPVDRFFASIAESGVSIADAMFVFDMQDDLPDNEFINMDTGYLDCRLVPDLSSMRMLTYRPGYALVFADAFDPDNDPHPLAPRSVLAKQVERCQQQGLDPLVATEMEFYLCTPDWEPAQRHIQYSSLTDALELEDVLRDMRDAIAGAGIEVESSNAEYGPGQIELNTGPTDAMTAADNTVLYKSIIKQVAVQHGLRATFMPKPWTEHSGSGMHVHTSLNIDGANAFADCDEEPNELMARWLAGILEHTLSLTLVGFTDIQRGQTDPALYLRPHPRSLGTRQPHGLGPMHHRSGIIGQSRGVPPRRRRCQPLPDHRRCAGCGYRRRGGGGLFHRP